MKLILAPMQGLTERLFRKTFHDCFPGAFDYAVSPFLSLTHGNLKDAEKKITDVLPELNRDSMPVVPQILGHEDSEFIELGNRLYELGYGEINWNLGCPMRRVAGKHRGSGLLPYPEELEAILEAVMPQLKPRLSVKIRLGYRSAEEIDRIIPILNRFPLSSVTLHPRIGKQMYSGRPDLDRFEEVLPLFQHPVIYNGDICSVADYRHIRNRFPSIQEVMIGRGALYNPLLPLQIRQSEEPTQAAPTPTPPTRTTPTPTNPTPTTPTRTTPTPTTPTRTTPTRTTPTSSSEDFIRLLTERILELPIERQAKVRKMKEYWCLLSKAVPGTEQQKRKVLHASQLEETRDLIFAMIQSN